MIHNGKKIIASYPQLHNTLPVPKETVQAWIDAGCPNEAIVEFEYWLGIAELNEVAENEDKSLLDDEHYYPKTDQSGNLILTLCKSQITFIPLPRQAITYELIICPLLPALTLI